MVQYKRSSFLTKEVASRWNGYEQLEKVTLEAGVEDPSPDISKIKQIFDVSVEDRMWLIDNVGDDELYLFHKESPEHFYPVYRIPPGEYIRSELETCRLAVFLWSPGTPGECYPSVYKIE